MKANSKVKMVISLAIILIVALFVISVFQLVAINKKQRELSAKQTEVERLTNMLEYYKEHKNNETGDGSDISVKGEN